MASNLCQRFLLPFRPASVSESWPLLVLMATASVAMEVIGRPPRDGPLTSFWPSVVGIYTSVVRQGLMIREAVRTGRAYLKVIKPTRVLLPPRLRPR